MAELNKRVTTAYEAVESDPEELRRKVEQKVAEGEGNSYPWSWRAWERFCSDEAIDPLNAHLEDFETFLWKGRTGDGKLYSFMSLEFVFFEIRRRYKLVGREPAFTWPQNQGEWASVWSARRSMSSGAAEKAIPITAAHAAALLQASPRGSVRARQSVVALLLALDLGWGSQAVCDLTWDQVQFGPASVRVRGLLVPCDHRERVPGLPHDCLACEIRSLRSEVAALGKVAPYEPYNWRRRLSQIERAFPGLTFTTEPSPTTVANGCLRFAEATAQQERYTVRRALVLWSGYSSGLLWLRDRAWAAMTYACGLRMASDFSRLSRSALTPCSSEAGWKLALGQAKNDPSGLRGDIRTYTQQRSPVVYAALTEYLLVRDLLVPDPDAPLIVAAGGSRTWPTLAERPTSASYVKAMSQRAIDRLAGLAGLEEEGYTPYSLRRGYAREQERAGRDVLFLMEALRHKDPNTTMGYLTVGEGARLAAQAFVEKLA